MMGRKLIDQRASITDDASRIQISWSNTKAIQG